MEDEQCRKRRNEEKGWRKKMEDEQWRKRRNEEKGWRKKMEEGRKSCPGRHQGQFRQ